MPALCIQLFGGFRLAFDGEPLTTVNTPRLRSLLAYLLLHRDAPQLRQRLAFVFWPDSTEQQARTNLRKNLFLLRQALPHADDFLLLEGQNVAWRADASFTLDVADFEAAVAEAERATDEATAVGALERAVGLYRGELLPGCYDEWLCQERERLGRMYGSALADLVTALEDRRAYEPAIGHARSLLQHDPLNEAHYRTLMRLWVLNGNRAGALNIYHTCVTTLQRELGVDPDSETQQLYEQLLHAPAAALPRPGAERRTLSLVGRDRQWVALREAWQRASGGKPTLIVLSGEAGIGKTRLAEELLDWVARQGGATARTGCHAAEGALAYAPVVGWLRAEAIRPPLTSLDLVWLAEVARLLPELLVEQPALPPPRPLTEGWQRRLFFEALARAVLLRETPLLLLIDDLQWCDTETLEWLHYLLRFDEGAPLCVVGTVRPEEAVGDHPLVEWLLLTRRDGYLMEMALGPLGPEETALLASQVAGQQLAPAEVAGLYRVTEGNPLFVVETVRMGRGTRPDGAFRLPETTPATVQAVILRRLVHTSPTAREVADLASVLGREFSYVVLERAAEMEEDVLLRGLDELWQRRLVHEQPREERHIQASYAFTHDRIRESAYAALAPARRRWLHQRAAQALQAIHGHDLDSISGQLARHYDEGGLPAEAVSFYQRAAEAAQNIYAQQEAMRYYRRALALLDELSVQGGVAAIAALTEKLGDILHLTGQYEEARTAYDRGLAQGTAIDRVQRAGLQRKIGNTWREQGHYELAFRDYGEASVALGPEPEEGVTRQDQPQAPAERWWQEWIAIRYERVQTHYWLGQADEAMALLEELRPRVERYGASHQRANLFGQLTALTLQRERVVPTKESRAYLRLWRAAIAESGLDKDRPAIPFQLGFYLLWHGELAEAEAHIQAALPLAQRSDDITLCARCLTYLTIIHRKQGCEGEVRRDAAQALEVARAARMPEYEAMARGNQAWLAWREGDMAGVRRHGEAAVDLWAQLPVGHGSGLFQWTALFPLLGAALQEGQVGEAIGYARAMLQPPQQRLPLEVATPLERAIQAGEDEDQTRHWLSEALARAAQMGYV